jgi:hypothetical protein
MVDVMPEPWMTTLDVITRMASPQLYMGVASPEPRIQVQD